MTANVMYVKILNARFPLVSFLKRIHSECQIRCQGFALRTNISPNGF